MTRVQASSIGLVLLLTLVDAGQLSAAGPTRPNILFLFSDDLTCQAISAYGDKRDLLQTPHMDRIAKEGMLFKRCLVTNSICGPSRATILTGKYSHLHGFYNNINCTFDSTQLTFPPLMQQAGYQTALIGKWHLGSDPVGFDYWNILPSQGAYYNPPMIENGKPVKHTGYVTDIITDLSVQWLKSRDHSKPFVLMCQHKAPHRMWEPALRDLGWDKDRRHREPETLFDAFGGRSKALSDHDMGLDRTYNDRDAKLVPPATLNEQQLKVWSEYYEPRNVAFRKDSPQGKDLIRWRYNRYMHDYLGCVKALDDNVGRLLKFLDDSGLAQNTVVFCSSDQGFYLGEHGWFDKRWAFEESVRSPLLVRWPGVTSPGSVNSSIVSLIDVPETFLEIAGASVPAEMQGRSMVPLLQGGQPADWRTSLYYHYYEFPVPHRVRPHYGVITDRYKLIHFYKPDVDDWELLDRTKDPLEINNYYEDPGYADVRKELHAELKRARQGARDVEPTPLKAHGNFFLNPAPSK